jgi:hypothetical protein
VVDAGGVDRRVIYVAVRCLEVDVGAGQGSATGLRPAAWPPQVGEEPSKRFLIRPRKRFNAELASSDARAQLQRIAQAA